MGRQSRRRLVQWGEHGRVQAHPDLEDGIIGLNDVEVHRAVVIVDADLDAVAQVVRTTLQGCVRVQIRPGVGVLYPQQPTVQDDLVRVAIQA